MTLKPKPLKVTTQNQKAKVIIQQLHKFINNMIRSFDLEINYENLQNQEDIPFDYFLQSTAWAI
jgi:hypothetical protein